MSIFSWFNRKKKGVNTRPSLPEEAKNRYPRGTVPPVKLIGIASANGFDLASTLAFTMSEACGWKPATITPDHFARRAVTEMFGVSHGTDPVTGIDFDDAVEMVRSTFEANYPGVWFRCLEMAKSRLPDHVVIVHGITTEDEAAWVRAHGGRVAGDGTIISATHDISVGLDEKNTYLRAAEVILDAITTKED